jgi:hypothetical protein
VAGQCVDACATGGCASSAECRAANHRPVCLCPQGLQGNPKVECKRVECAADTDCESNKKCESGACINPCARQNACGTNAQCKTLRHVKTCSCPTGFIGNPNVECTKDINNCLSSPCGPHAICQNLVGGYDCRCQIGCTGDPFVGCLCGGPLVDPCLAAQCGLGAQCSVQGTQAICSCPANRPNGDPLVECSAEKGKVKILYRYRLTSNIQCHMLKTKLSYRKI